MVARSNYIVLIQAEIKNKTLEMFIRWSLKKMLCISFGNPRWLSTWTYLSTTERKNFPRVVLVQIPG